MGVGNKEARTVLFVGETWNNAFIQVASSYTGIEQEKLRVEHDWHSQVKGTKDNITIQGLPEEFGRMPAFRQRAAAYNESHAFIIMANNSPNKLDLSYITEQIKRNGGEKKPILILGTFTEPQHDTAYPHIQKTAAGMNAKYEYISEAKLKVADKNEIQKLQRIINSHVELTYTTTTPTGEETPATPTTLTPKEKENKEMEAKQQTTWRRLVSFIRGEVSNSGHTTAA